MVLLYAEEAEAISETGGRVHSAVHMKGHAELLLFTLGGGDRQERSAPRSRSRHHPQRSIRRRRPPPPCLLSPSPYPIPAARIRIVQDGARDVSTCGEYRADESGGWVWEASRSMRRARRSPMKWVEGRL